MKIAMSSGHGLHIRGARGNPVPPQLDEVDAARRLVDGTAKILNSMSSVECQTFHDDTSKDQSTNLSTITNWHNNKAFGGGDHDYDVSVHFNAFDQSAHGTEVLWKTQEILAGVVSAAIAKAGDFHDRGAKYRDDLYVLNNTREKAILIEAAFCDNTADSNRFNDFFEEICAAIAEAITGKSAAEEPSEADLQAGILFQTKGAVSHFGGPEDTTGVTSSEGLAFIFAYEPDEYPHHLALFLPQQPPNTTGLARRLNADNCPYVACRWDYAVTPKTMLAQAMPALVRATKTGKMVLAWPADWGPHEEKTGRNADVSPYVLRRLGIETDDEVEVIYPAPLRQAMVARLAMEDKK